MIGKILKMAMLEDDDELAYTPDARKRRASSSSDGRPAWMRQLQSSVLNWQQLVPKVHTPC
jgi:dynein heavy chain 1